MRVWRRFRALAPSERRALIVAAMRLAAVHTLLALVGVQRTQRVVARVGTAIDRNRAETAARAVLRAASHLPLRTNCLDRALTLSWMLGAAGLAATLQIGVRKADETTLAAHAWVEHGGAVLLDDTAAHYAVLPAGGR